MDKPLEQAFLQCRKCGSSGVAVWENPASDFPDDRRLVSLSDGFYQRPLVGVPLPEIICDHCGTGQTH
jgi:hypothetical protein